MITKEGEYQTRGGRAVKILDTDMGGNFPVLAKIETFGGGWMAMQYAEDGRFVGDDKDLDLVPVPKKFRFERWVNIYSDTDIFHLAHSRDDADIGAHVNRIACLKVVLEGVEGEGLHGVSHD